MKFHQDQKTSSDQMHLTPPNGKTHNLFFDFLHQRIGRIELYKELSTAYAIDMNCKCESDYFEQNFPPRKS